MPILECNQLSKSYGKVPALDGVSFAMSRAGSWAF